MPCPFHFLRIIMHMFFASVCVCVSFLLCLCYNVKDITTRCINAQLLLINMLFFLRVSFLRYGTFFVMNNFSVVTRRWLQITNDTKKVQSFGTFGMHFALLQQQLTLFGYSNNKFDFNFKWLCDPIVLKKMF